MAQLREMHDDIKMIEREIRIFLLQKHECQCHRMGFEEQVDGKSYYSPMAHLNISI